MPRLGKMRLQNYVLFKDVEFDFDRQGITVIQGLNLNGNQSKELDHANTNFVGKSALVSALPDLFLKEGVTGRAKDKFKSGEGSLDVYDTLPNGTDVHWHVRKFFKGRSERYEILRNGKDKTPERIADQQALAASILGRDATTFSVVDYLDNRQPHALRTGDTARRRDFFSTFFDLSSPDAIRKLIKLETDKLKVKAGVRDELVTQLAALRATLKGFDASSTIEALEKYKRFKDKAESQLDKLKSQRAYARWLADNKALLKSLKPYIKQDSSLKTLQSVVFRQLKSSRAALKAYNALADYESDLRSYRKTLADYKEKLSILSEQAKDVGLAGLDDELARLGKLKTRLATRKATALDVLATQENALFKLSHAVETVREKLSSDYLTVCEACGQQLSAKHVKHAEAQHRKAKDDLAKLKLQVKQVTAEVLTIKETLQSIERRLESVRRDESKLQNLNAVRKSLTRPQPPSKPDVSELPENFDASLTHEKVAQLKGIHSALEEFDTEAYRDYFQSYLAGTTSDYSDAVYDAAVDKLHAYTTKLIDAENTLANWQSSKAELSSLKARIAELNEELADAEALKVLSQAFASNSGVKQLIIKTLCRKLEEKVNQYAGIVFNEPYTFEFDLDTQFTINAIRQRANGQHLVSDVRKLSGAEAGFFDIILALALRSFQPERRRLNVLVLDEMSANYGPDMTAAFINLLPKLTQIVPHVIVVTPRTRDIYPDGTRYLTVVKKGSYSKLVEGKVLQ